MNQPRQQINLVMALSFIFGILSVKWFNLAVSLCLTCLLFFLPNILSLMGLLQVKSYRTQELLKIRATLFVFGAMDCLCLKHLNMFSVYLIILTIYHVGEFELVNMYHHNQIKWSSFLIYHSKQYTIANAFCLLEHFVTKYLLDLRYKQYNPLVPVAFVLMVGGLAIRLLAFYGAKSNFTHLVQDSKRENHQLVTTGIFKYIRHPGYLGFFVFSVSSMLFIGNFFCAVAYFLVLRSFFKQRIHYEEYRLLQFFPQYESYRRQTPHWMPFKVDNQINYQ